MATSSSETKVLVCRKTIAFKIFIVAIMITAQVPAVCDRCVRPLYTLLHYVNAIFTSKLLHYYSCSNYDNIIKIIAEHFVI